MKRHSSTPGLTAALATIAILFTACSDDADGQAASPPSTSEPSPTGSATNAAPEADYSIVGATYLEGPGRWALRASGDPDAPMAVFDVPAGFDARESFVWTDGVRGFGQLSYWAPTRVLADPCNVDKPSKPLGPTVEDLAAALAAQKRTTTTEPIPVELDGHRGLYLELQSPARFDYAACGGGGGGGGMLIWEAGEAGDGRGLEEPTTDRYWIIDVDGKRVVVAALTVRGAASEVIERVNGVAETTTFVDPE
jgi:hypothetical protein